MVAIDLHTHTFYSDGLMDPKSLVRLARYNGLDCLAITDHDITEGYFEAKEEASRWGLGLIPGVEISSGKYHILGLNIEPKEQGIQKFLGEVREVEYKRSLERISIINSVGVPISMQKVKKIYPNSRIGKYNILLTMVSDPGCREYLEEIHGNVDSQEIFHYYLGKKGIAGNIGEKNNVDPIESICKIHNSGGIAVLAHPFKDVDRMVEVDSLFANGLDALEVQPNYGKENAPFVSYAKDNEIPLTYGSDFHRPDRGYMLSRVNTGSIDKSLLNKYKEVA
jgi:hypothetical protein